MEALKQNISLKPYNTFGIEATALYWTEINNAGELQVLLQHNSLRSLPIFILGGGSNILLTKDIEGLVIKINIQGIELVRENEKHYWLKVGAGVNWHQFVMYCVNHNYAGLENLSLIPGTVGAAPMQNIGAYGVEIEQVFDSLEAVNRATGEIQTFTHSDCKFGYRESIFKKELKDQFIITTVCFRLDKEPVFHTSYGAIQETLRSMNILDTNLSIKAISDAVIQIRRTKLPDPAIIGNAGSFFKNPEITVSHFNLLKNTFPFMPGYPINSVTIKVPAGWLIEQCGWKGKRIGDTGVHSNQALVLVNYGSATGASVVALSGEIQASVFEKFGVLLETEVNVI